MSRLTYFPGPHSWAQCHVLSIALPCLPVYPPPRSASPNPLRWQVFCLRIWMELCCRRVDPQATSLTSEQMLSTCGRSTPILPTRQTRLLLGRPRLRSRHSLKLAVEETAYRNWVLLKSWTLSAIG